MNDTLKVGGRVRYTSDATPILRGREGTVMDMRPKQAAARVNFDDFDELVIPLERLEVVQ